MSDVSEQARFAARAFVVRVEHEMGEPMNEHLRERMEFAYEMGYMRGVPDGMRRVMEMHDEALSKVVR